MHKRRRWRRCDDGEDAFPRDSSEWSDNDGDGIGDNEDSDDDEDGTVDADDDFPLGQGLFENQDVGCKYNDAYFNVTVNYQGHNSFDEYTVVGTVPGADGAQWSVEFQNSTGSWSDTHSFDLGLGNSDLSDQISLRVVPAFVGSAHHSPQVTWSWSNSQQTRDTLPTRTDSGSPSDQRIGDI